jgi:hypothetical protein
MQFTLASWIVAPLFADHQWALCVCHRPNLQTMCVVENISPYCRKMKKKIGYWRVMYVILFAMGAEVLVSSPVCPVESMCMAVRVCIAGPL